MATAERVSSGEWSVTNAEYHADCSRVGKSMLDDFRRSRRLYEARYITKTIAPAEQSQAMFRGSCLHMRVLEPERYETTVLIRKQFDRRTKDGKQQAFEQDAAALRNGWTLIDQEVHDEVEQIAQAILDNERAMSLLAFTVVNEHSIYWTDQYTGLECKSRRDRVSDQLIIDLKTCESATPWAFARASAYYGYNRQNAWYIDGHRECYGVDPAFVFIVASHERPYQAACYELDEAAIKRGRQENRDALTALASCIESGDWSDPFERQITRLSLPDWCFRDDWRIA